MKRDGTGRLRPVQMGVPASGVVGEQVGVVGELTVRHIRGGQVIFEETDRNLITKSGLSQFAKLAIGESNLGAFYIQIGTGGVNPSNPNSILEPNANDTALIDFYAEGETVRTIRETPAVGIPGTTTYVPYSVTARMAYTFDFHETVRIPEAGLFTAPHASNPVMIAHRIFFPREMVDQDFLELVWEIGFSRYPTKG
jgi:hypothetical protein